VLNQEEKSMTEFVKITTIKKKTGVAGQIGYTTKVTIAGEPHTVTFVSSSYGGPVVMVTDAMPDGMVVARPERFGSKLTPAWVRQFFAPPTPEVEDVLEKGKL